MKTQVTTLIALLMLVSMSMWADETITVTATQDEIAEQLDLKAVANIFGQAKNLEEFEKLINDEEQHISNLDLNGDGQVDYLRVIETAEGNKHLVIIQAVLAQDIFQDIASIYVERDESTQTTTVQVVGDEYIYGTNYIIEPVYVVTPIIFDWFWGPTWSVWYSPYYWGYYPAWWHPFGCWAHDIYWGHIYNWHHWHSYCSYRHPHEPRPGFHSFNRNDHRRDFATRHPNSGFNSRHGNMRNARELQPARNSIASRNAAPATRSAAANGARQTANSRTFNSVHAGNGNTRLSSNTRTISGSTRNGQVQGRTTSASTRSSASYKTTGGARRDANTASRSASASTRNSATASTSRSSASSASATRSSGSVSRNSTSTPSRSSSSYSGRSSRNSASTPSRSSSSYSGRSSRSSASTPSRSSSSYSGGSRSSYSGGSSRSSGSYSGGRSSGGFSGGGSRSGGSSGGGSRSGGGGGGRR